MTAQKDHVRLLGVSCGMYRDGGRDLNFRESLTEKARHEEEEKSRVQKGNQYVIS